MRRKNPREKILQLTKKSAKNLFCRKPAPRIPKENRKSEGRDSEERENPHWDSPRDSYSKARDSESGIPKTGIPKVMIPKLGIPKMGRFRAPFIQTPLRLASKKQTMPAILKMSRGCRATSPIPL